MTIKMIEVLELDLPNGKASVGIGENTCVEVTFRTHISHIDSSFDHAFGTEIVYDTETILDFPKFLADGDEPYNEDDIMQALYDEMEEDWQYYAKVKEKMVKDYESYNY